MKRPRQGSSNTPSPSDNTNAVTPRHPPKRAKASQACASCRKHKTRCELLESSGYHSRCHRCDVLSITCSFETNTPPDPLPDNSPRTTLRRHLLRTIFSSPEANSDKCLELTQCEVNGPAPRPIVTSPWEFLKVPGIPDWTATPMLAMLTLSKMASNNQPIIQPTANLSFTEVLTGDQIQYLLGVYVTLISNFFSSSHKCP
jgi:Fungal Zn(2)-Cys(6) binuclear cluster domain